MLWWRLHHGCKTIGTSCALACTSSCIGTYQLQPSQLQFRLFSSCAHVVPWFCVQSSQEKLLQPVGTVQFVATRAAGVDWRIGKTSPVHNVCARLFDPRHRHQTRFDLKHTAHVHVAGAIGRGVQYFPVSLQYVAFGCLSNVLLST